MTSQNRKEEEPLRNWMHAFAAAPPPESNKLDPGFIWWKGELMRRLDAQQRTSASLDFGERACAGIGMAAALALGVSLLRRSLPSLLLIATITTIVGLIGFAWLAFSHKREN